MKKIFFFIGLSCMPMMVVQPMIRRCWSNFQRKGSGLLLNKLSLLDNQKDVLHKVSSDIGSFYIIKNTDGLALTSIKDTDFVMKRRVSLNNQVVILNIHPSVSDQDLKKLMMALDDSSPRVQDYVGATFFVMSGFLVVIYGGTWFIHYISDEIKAALLERGFQTYE